MTTLQDAVRLLSDSVERQHLGAQLYVSQSGRPLVDTAVGFARPGVRMTPDSLTFWTCATKPIIATAVLRCWEQGLLDIHDPLAEHVDALASVDSLKGVTIKDALTHSTPIPIEDDPLQDHRFMSLEAAINTIATNLPSRVQRQAARDANYASWAFVVLAHIVETVTRESFGKNVRDNVLIPLGMSDTWIGMPVEEQSSNRDRLSGLFEFRRLPAMELAEFTEPKNLATILPPFGGLGPVNQLGRFYESLLRIPSRPSVLSPQTVAAMTARHRVGLAEFHGIAIDFGLGVELESRHYGAVATSFGHQTSLQTFGHKGESCLIAFADPAFEIVVACHVNGIIEGREHGKRVWTVVDAIYQSLDLHG